MRLIAAEQTTRYTGSFDCLMDVDKFKGKERKG